MSDIVFEQGGSYRAHIAVVAPIVEPSAQRVMDALVKETGNQLEGLKVYAGEAPSNWPANQREDTSPLGYAGYWIEGTWKGKTGSIPQSTSVYQVLWVQRMDADTPKDQYEAHDSPYEWIPVAGALLLMGVALYTAVKGASR